MNKKEYLLTCLIEECAEVQQVAAKILRFGAESKHPESDMTNIQCLDNESNHIQASLKMLQEYYPSSFVKDDLIIVTKMEKVQNYMKLSHITD